MDKIKTICDWLKSMVGTGYVYGATGWICSLTRREQQAKQYPIYADTIMTTCAKWDGKICHDCAQLSRKALAQAGITLPSGATSQWKAAVWAEKGTIDTLPKDKLCCLFRATGDTMQHVLVYLGDATEQSPGTVIDSRGSSQGVMQTKLGDYKATHWAVPAGLYDNNDKKEGSTMPEPTNSNYAGKSCQVIGGGLNMRITKDQSGVKVTQIPNGKTVTCYTDDGTWALVIYEGAKTYGGFVKKEFLKEVV